MSYHKRKVLVTGADGFIGSHLAEALARAGARVTAMAQYNAFGAHGWLDELDDEVRDGIDLASGDLRDAAYMTRLVAGHEIVFHLGALIAIPFSYHAPQSYIDVNVTGTMNLLEAARAAGCARVVHTSTSEVYGTALFTPITEAHPLQAQSPYAASKIGADMLAEAYVRSFDLPVIVLRPFNTYGPRQSERAVIPTIVRQALDPECAQIRLGDLSPKRDFTYVSDTVAAFLAAGDDDGLEPGTPYNAGAGTTITIGEVAERLVALTGTGKEIVAEPARMRPEKSEVRLLQADSTKFHAATGWAPAVEIDRGLELTVAWWQQRLQQGRLRRGTGFAT